MDRVKTAVLISGRGSNLQALIDAAADPAFPAQITLVLSNTPDAAGLDRAHQAGIATAVVPHRTFPDRSTFDDAIHRVLTDHGVALVCLAGFMRILGAEITRAWQGRMLNIHPSLLPSFKGLDTHRRVLASGARFSGCTVHFVTADMDAGPIIAQSVLPVLPDDTDDVLADRVLAAEHRCFPLALRLVASGCCRLYGDRVIYRDVAWPDNGITTPIAPAKA